MIDQLPNDISALEILEELYLRENRLTTLPWELGGLHLLTWLDLGQNKLVPPSAFFFFFITLEPRVE